MSSTMCDDLEVYTLEMVKLYNRKPKNYISSNHTKMLLNI